MEKYIIRIFSIDTNIEKGSIKIFFKNFGEILKKEKILLKNNNKEYLLKFSCNLENLKQIKIIEYNGSNKLKFSFRIFKYNKYKLESITSKLFINKIPNFITKKLIYEAFKGFGKIKKIILCNNNKNNIKFSFIYFNEKISSLNWINKYKFHYIKDNWVEISLSKRSNNKKKKKNINNTSQPQDIKKVCDDLYLNKGLTLFKILDKKKRANSLKSLSYKMEKITKYNLKKNTTKSKNNTTVIKNEILNQLVKNLYNNSN